MKIDRIIIGRLVALILSDGEYLGRHAKHVSPDVMSSERIKIREHRTQEIMATIEYAESLDENGDPK